MKRLTVLAAIASSFLLLGAQSAFAVNEFCDSVVGAPGTGVCTVSTSHPPTSSASGAFTIDRNLHITGTGKLITGATGIDITITKGDFLMDAGAIIDGNVAGNNTGGPITVNLLDGDVDMAPGSIIRSNSNSGGAIKITTAATHTIDIDGLVESVGSSSGTGATQAPGGGTITIVAGCGLTVSDDGRISSRGFDPGADLVHLQGCTVVIDGLVESTGTGHTLPNNPANHCNLDPAAHPVGGAQFYDACVEIWGDTVTINSILPHKGEVNANGPRNPGRGWIDVFARHDIAINNDAVGNYSVHANSATSVNTNSFGGLITVKSSIGKVTTSGLAIQANGTGGGSNGGDVIVQAGGAGAAGDVAFGTATIQATGPNGSNTAGGHIAAKSFNGSVTGAAPGALNAAGGLAQAIPVPGTVVLEACIGNPAATYLGTVTGNRTDTPGVCGGTPSFSLVGHWDTGQSPAQFIAAAATCATTQCGGTCTKSGAKFNDLAADHVKDATDPPLGGWEIKLWNATQTAVLATTNTAADGSYSFPGLAPGTYVVCETPQATWNQTFPVAGAGIVACANGTLGYQFTLAFDAAGVCEDTGNDFGNNKPSHKRGMKFNDVDGNGVKDPGDAGIAGWPINLYQFPGPALVQTVNTDASGNYTFTIAPAGNYRVCEGQKAGATTSQTFPNALTVHGGETIVNTCPLPNIWGYEFTVTSGTEFADNDFGNHGTTTNCPEDPTAVLTKTVSNPSSGVPNFDTVQAAYDAAVNGDVIGMFGNTKENVTLGDAKTLKITQCTSAKITALDNTLPVWNITSTGKLTIVGPDSVGGTIGWLIANASGGPHTLKSVRANNASIWGIRINSNGNNVSWNDVSGNGGPGGILVAGNSNILKGGTVGPNNGDGVKITGNSNSLSGATVDSNSGNGVLVTGSSNQIKSNKASLNGVDGFANGIGAGNKYTGNSSNVSGENTGNEYSFVTAGVNGGSNRADGINVPKTSVPTKCADFAQANTVCE